MRKKKIPTLKDEFEANRGPDGRFLGMRMMNNDIWRVVMERFATGESIPSICREPIELPDGRTVKVSHQCIYLYKYRNPSLREDYEEARRMWADAQMDLTVDIADGNEPCELQHGRVDDAVRVGRDNLRIKTRQFNAERQVAAWSARQQLDVSCPSIVLNLDGVSDAEMEKFDKAADGRKEIDG